MLSDKLRILVLGAKPERKQKYNSLLKDYGFNNLPFNNPQGIQLNSIINDFCLKVEQIGIRSDEILRQIKQTLLDFENNGRI